MSFIKSPYGAGVAVSQEIRAVHATTKPRGPSTGIRLECRTHHNVSGKGDRATDHRLSAIGIYAADTQVYR